MREDVVRLSGIGRPASLRWRAEFSDWWTILDMEVNVALFKIPTIASVINFSGFTQGIGEWRPERGGQHGMFRVATEADKREFENLYGVEV